MPESKITTTERLRREGRWDEASAFRDEERQRLRSEGMSRKEASEEAWRLMREEFRPLSEGLFWSFYVLADLPPLLCLKQSEPDAPDFDDVWWAFCRLAGCCCYVDSSIVNVDALEPLLEERMRDESEPDESKIQPKDSRLSLLDMAFNEPIRFWELVEKSFNSAVTHIRGTSSYAKDTKKELRFYLSKLPDLEGAWVDVLGIWAGLLSPTNPDTEEMICLALSQQHIESEMAE